MSQKYVFTLFTRNPNALSTNTKSEDFNPYIGTQDRGPRTEPRFTPTPRHNNPLSFPLDQPHTLVYL